ncbi:hypothetical protein BVRB_4g086090 [Beta vulgaris subsp. vulgaris]|nr:hypothetical protein BVRB_4g086090 [Beta vulgaris subsp. vulgaris]
MPGATTLKESATLRSMVEKQAADGRLHAAICAAPAVALGSWGLLKGLKATCYPSFMEQLSSSATVVESRVQQDGKVVTSRGAGTTMEYSVTLVEQLYGKQKADEVVVAYVFLHEDYILYCTLSSRVTIDASPFGLFLRFWRPKGEPIY